jgi:hypothetical protein
MPHAIAVSLPLFSNVNSSAYGVRKRYQKLYFHFKPEKFYWCVSQWWRSN